MSLTLETDAPVLSWVSQDIEHRFGVRAGRFTRASSVFSFCIAVLLTAAGYGSLLPFRDTHFAQMFTERGVVQYLTVLFGFWALTILFIKTRKIKAQRRALGLKLVPQVHDFVLTAATADQVLSRLQGRCDDPRSFILLNRIELALSNLKNMGRISDFVDMLQSQADNDEDVVESSYSLLRGLVWAIPVLGFIGTVQGLSQAVGHFGSVLTENTEVGTLKPALQGVTAGLATAFETTFVALVAALAIQLLLTMVKRSEEELLDDCKEYCQRELVGRVRILPFENQ